MSLKETSNIRDKDDSEVSHKEISSSFNPVNKNNRTGAQYSTFDSAYNSMVCSPFNQVVLSKASKTISLTSQENYPNTHESISPFLDINENEDVFKVSLEQICADKIYPESKILPTNNYLNKSDFRPISIGNEIPGIFTRTEEILSKAQMLQFNHRFSLVSKKSISTQTKCSMGSVPMYRPNSAPLQEGIEEELEEIHRDEMMDVGYHMHRNFTCHSIRSPMPDLILPTFHNNNQEFASKLSLIADQIDETINPRTSANIRPRRIRRFSTPSIAELTPGGSFVDLLVSIYNAFDNTLPRRSTRRHTTSSLSENN